MWRDGRDGKTARQARWRSADCAEACLRPRVSAIAEVFVAKDAQGGALHVLVLAVAQRPQEGEEPGEAEADGDRQEIDQHIHAAPWMRGAIAGAAPCADGPAARLRRCRRSALSVTNTD